MVVDYSTRARERGGDTMDFYDRLYELYATPEHAIVTLRSATAWDWYEWDEAEAA